MQEKIAPTAPAGCNLVVVQIYNGATFPCQPPTQAQPLKQLCVLSLSTLMACSPMLAANMVMPAPARADYQDRVEAMERRKALLQKAYV